MKLTVGDTAHLAQYDGLDAPFPEKELHLLRDISGGVVRHITRDFISVGLEDGKETTLARKWLCKFWLAGHPSVPCPCGYGASDEEAPEIPMVRVAPDFRRAVFAEWLTGPLGSTLLVRTCEELIEGKWERFISVEDQAG